METSEAGYVIALDVGERRVGVAITHSLAALPKPLTTLENNETFWANLQELLDKEQVIAVVVGLPRGMQGQETAQTEYVRSFIEDLKQHVLLPIHLQDEAVTSVLAEESLEQAGKGYNKAMVDAEAAAIILQDYLTERQSTHG